MKKKCECGCGKVATWCYLPNDGDWYCCDDCVPRGCSCNNDLDDKGRKEPCCEWFYDEKGWHE